MVKMFRSFTRNFGPLVKFLHKSGRNGECLEQKVSVLGVPFEKGQHRCGVSEGPRYLRDSGLLTNLEFLGYDAKDCGDIEYEPCGADCKIDNVLNLEHFAACGAEVSKRVQSIIENKSACLTLGGDHSISVGTIDGHTRAVGGDNIAVLYIDAHADINTNCTSHSGNIHGMTLGLLAKELSEEWPTVECLSWISKCFSLKNIAFIGLRSVDNAEREILDKYDVTRFTMDDVERNGIHNVVDLAMRKIDPHNNKSIHVSFDIDSLDQLEARSTGYAIRGGLTLREALHIMEAAYQTGRLRAVDLVEINPQIGDEKDVSRTLEAAHHVIAAAFGHSRRGYNKRGPIW